MHTPQELLTRYSGPVTPSQRDYMESYIKTGSYVATAKQFRVNESTVRKAIQLVLNQATLQQNTVAEHMNEELSPALSVKGTSAMYDQDGNRRIHWIKTEKNREQIYNDLVDAMENLSQELPKMPKQKRESTKVDPELLTVYPLGDPHIGLLTYTPEVGVDWDLKIAEKMFLPLFDKLVTTAPASNECLIIDLGDFWHYDGMEQKTMRSGHKVDADGRPSKMIQVGYRILLSMIESALRIHKKVNVKIMPGNHDDLGSIFLRVSLWHIYEGNPRVNIDLSPSVFQYFHWGDNLLGIHHGDKCKANALPMVMASDQALLWGCTKFRKWLIGHFHHDSTIIYSGQELQGCTAETFRTIVAGEGYAHEAGYRPLQDGKAIVFHKQYGEVERYTVNISQVR